MKNLQMYINGQFCESSNGKWIDVLNPSTGRHHRRCEPCFGCSPCCPESLG